MTINDLEPKIVFGIFDEITKVPRPSKKEGKIREFLLEFAKRNNIEAKTDPIGNVAMRIPATPGKENAPTIVLQGHMDMVPNQTKPETHNFDTDPILTEVTGEWLHSKDYKTTLGADNGIGVAASLAALTDKTLVHGPLEALFTIDEETGLTGAKNLGKDMITGNILVNLDSEEEAQIFLGCAGGIDTLGHFAYTDAPAPEGYEFFKFSILKFTGGHSGSDINLGRANANKQLARFLFSLYRAYNDQVSLADINGGELRNVIPGNAYAVIGVPADKKEDLRKRVNEFAATIEEEFGNIEGNQEIKLESETAPATVIDAAAAKRVVWCVNSIPNAVIAMSRRIEGMVNTSTNTALIRVDRDKHVITITTSQRSEEESRKFDIAGQIYAHFEICGAEVEQGDGYPGWTPNMDSEILKVAVKAYEDLYGITPLCTSLHAGLECGNFLVNNPKLDMISFGPTLRDVHTPKESMHIPAVDKFWKHLRRIIEMIADEKK